MLTFLYTSSPSTPRTIEQKGLHWLGYPEDEAVDRDVSGLQRLQLAVLWQCWVLEQLCKTLACLGWLP
jgi:hypothetical protein